VDWTPTLASLAQALPDSAYLLSMTAEGIELRLAGLAASASTIVPALEASPFLNNVSLTVARRAQGAMDSERFDVAALLNPEMIRRPDGTVFERDQ
jgi:Tfp pilus assembly protein PilN